MISPLRPRTADLASRRARPHKSNETALRFVPRSPVSRGKERTRAAPSPGPGAAGCGRPCHGIARTWSACRSGWRARCWT